MREIKVYVNDGSLYLNPYYMWDTDIDDYINQWKEILFPKAKEIEADHFIYATKEYDENDQLCEVNIYMKPLTNKEFFERTEMLCKQKNVLIYAWHKGTSY